MNPDRGTPPPGILRTLWADGSPAPSAWGWNTAFVAFEKLTRFGPRGTRVSGALLVAVGLWILVR